MSVRCRLGYHAPVPAAYQSQPMGFGSHSMTNAICRRCGKRSWQNWSCQGTRSGRARIPCNVSGEPTVALPEPSALTNEAVIGVTALTHEQLRKVARRLDCNIEAALDHVLAWFFAKEEGAPKDAL